jgi:DNA ligase-1
MRRFARLLDRLFYTYGNLAKARLLLDYLRETPDPDRGYAVAIIAGTLDIPEFKRSMVRDLIASRVDPVLVDLSYDYVGELSETVAHLWPGTAPAEDLPALSAVVTALRSLPKAEMAGFAAARLDEMTSTERWAFLKLGSRGGLRVGVSARFLKQVLAQFGGRDVAEIEATWHGVAPPYETLFAWLEGRAERPLDHGRPVFHPVMLAQPLEDRDHASITPDSFAAEWKYDGIRVQIVAKPGGKALYSRSGDDIGESFPDVLDRVAFDALLDGELLVRSGDGFGTFNDLQQRLNRKNPSRKLLASHPAVVMAYDMLADGETDLTARTYLDRRGYLEAWLERFNPPGILLSPLIDFTDFDALVSHRLGSASQEGPIEGVMLKRKDSRYVAGRPSGQWYKWKRDPMVVDAVLMYAQRGHGKRSSLYSDYTFGLWREDVLLPIGKAYFGFTDAELQQLDRWIRHHTLQSFGPVREVAKELVFEVAFDAVNRSTRHKSGFALRFPRISRIRWDKPAAEADHMEALAALARATSDR